MFAKKNFAIFFILIILSTVLTACGGKTTTPPPVEPGKNEDFQGEGPVQGGSKSNEELVVLEEKGTQYEGLDMREAGESVHVEIEASEAESTYISVDNFWQGDNYFDLEEFLYMNGAEWVKKGDWNLDSGGFEERTDKVNVYQAYYKNNYWMVTITAPVTVEFEYVGYELDGKTIFAPEYAVTPSTPYEEQKNVTVNEFGTEITDATIQILDDMLYLTKKYPESDNPFQYSERNGLYIAISDDADIPAGAVHK